MPLSVPTEMDTPLVMPPNSDGPHSYFHTTLEYMQLLLSTFVGNDKTAKALCDAQLAVILSSHQAVVKQEQDSTTAAHEHELERITAAHRLDLERITAAHRLDLEHQQSKHQALTNELRDENAQLRHEKELAGKDLSNLRAISHEKFQHLRHHIAQLECINPSGIRKPFGTHTVAELWEDHPKLPPGESPWITQDPSVPAKAVKPLLRTIYAEETHIYPPLIALVQQLLARSKLSVLDTSTNKYLSNRKPDITVQAAAPYIAYAIPGFVLALIEVKLYPQHKVLSGADKGQMLDCLYRLMEAQPWRRVFVGLVTSLHHNCWIQLIRSPVGEHQLTEISGCESLQDALSYLVDVVARDATQMPATPQFSSALGQCRGLLGVTNNSLVAKFQWPTTPSTKKFISLRKPTKQELEDDEDGENKAWIAVKRPAFVGVPASSRGNRHHPRSLKHEIELLRLLRDHTCPSLPHLVCYTTTYSELGISPVGENLHPAQLLARPALAIAVLQDIYDALKYLHDAGWVHRDVRWANIIVTQGRGVLVDFETAHPLHERKEVKYAGGYLCLPPRLLHPARNLAQISYVPAPGDDWTAYILLLAALILPGPGDWLSEHFEARRGKLGKGYGVEGGWGVAMSAVANCKSRQRAFLVAFWKALRNAAFWNKYFQIADPSGKRKEVANADVDEDQDEDEQPEAVVDGQNEGADGDGEVDDPYEALRNMATAIFAIVAPHTPASSPSSSRASSSRASSSRASSSRASSATNDIEHLVSGTEALQISVAGRDLYELTDSSGPPGSGIEEGAGEDTDEVVMVDSRGTT